ncbi:MAG: MAPEG family protein [Patescibacteria group bacterium]
MYDITSLYAALLALIFLVLSVRVILARSASGISLGSGEDQNLLRKVRAHSHFAEYVPFTLLLLLLAESQQIIAPLVHACGSMLVVSRLVHAYGVDQPVQKIGYRIAGMILTFTPIALLAVCLFISL